MEGQDYSKPAGNRMENIIRMLICKVMTSHYDLMIRININNTNIRGSQRRNFKIA